VGPNPIAIVVTAEDGSTKNTYTVTVTRAEGTFTILPSAADGYYFVDQLFFCINSGEMTLYGKVYTLKYDEEMDVHTYSATGDSFLLGGTWNGASLQKNGEDIPKITLPPASSYSSLPVEADGTWFLSGAEKFTVTAGVAEFFGDGKTVFLISDSENNVYGITSSGVASAISGLSWTDSLFHQNGISLTKGTKSTEIVLSELPSSAHEKLNILPAPGMHFRLSGI